MQIQQIVPTRRVGMQLEMLRVILGLRATSKTFPDVVIPLNAYFL
jgi:hypothetical protein